MPLTLMRKVGFKIISHKAPSLKTFPQIDLVVR